MKVIGYWDAAGTFPAGSPIPLPDSQAVQDLGSLGMPQGCRSFRYEVDFNCSFYPGQLRDSPVFESIWFSFRRRGISPAWTSWQEK